MTYEEFKKMTFKDWFKFILVHLWEWTVELCIVLVVGITIKIAYGLLIMFFFGITMKGV